MHSDTMHLRWWSMNNSIVVDSLNEISAAVSINNVQPHVASNRDWSHKHDVEGKKPGTKEYTLCDSINVKYKKRSKECV